MIERRRFLLSALGFVAAPMIVRAASLMPVRALELPPVAPLVIDPFAWKSWNSGVVLNSAWGRTLRHPVMQMVVYE